MLFDFLDKVSDWFDLDVFVCNVKASCYHSQLVLLFLHEQTKYLVEGQMKCRLLLRLLNVSFFIEFVKSLQVFFETRHFVTVYDLSSVSFKVDNKWKSVWYWVVKVIRWDKVLRNRKWFTSGAFSLICFKTGSSVSYEVTPEISIPYLARRFR